MARLLTLSELAMRWHVRRCHRLAERAFELAEPLLPPVVAERIRADIYASIELRRTASLPAATLPS